MIPIGLKNEDINAMDSTARSNRLLGPPSLTHSAPLFINETIASLNDMHSLSNVRGVNETNRMSSMSLYDLLSFNSNTTLWPFEVEDHHLLSNHHSCASRHLVESMLFPMTGDERRPCRHCRTSSCRRNEVQQILDETLSIVSQTEEEVRYDTN
jgi:hypothetical protein